MVGSASWSLSGNEFIAFCFQYFTCSTYGWFDHWRPISFFVRICLLHPANQPLWYIEASWSTGFPSSNSKLECEQVLGKFFWEKSQIRYEYQCIKFTARKHSSNIQKLQRAFERRTMCFHGSFFFVMNYGCTWYIKFFSFRIKYNLIKRLIKYPDLDHQAAPFFLKTAGLNLSFDQYNMKQCSAIFGQVKKKWVSILFSEILWSGRFLFLFFYFEAEVLMLKYNKTSYPYLLSFLYPSVQAHHIIHKHHNGTQKTQVFGWLIQSSTKFWPSQNSIETFLKKNYENKK